MRQVPHAKWQYIERWPRRHHNPHDNILLLGVKLTTKSRPRTIELESGHGKRDDVYVYRERARAYVLVINRSLDYAEYALADELEDQGDYKSLAPVSDIFLQSDTEIEQMLGSRGLDLAPATILRKLQQYLS